jgi:pyruvate dehydrogenase E2 component (dihydrolipoamide acetyltransferase)
MPSLGADMEVGTLIQWLVKPGDVVKRGDIVAVVDTEKAAIEIEVFEAGVIEALVVQEGETVPVGAVLAIIRLDGQPATTAIPPVKEEPAAIIPAAKSPPSPPPTPPPPVPPPAIHPARVHATPVAQRMATERGIDLASVKGTGPGGMITKDDVEKAVKREAPARVEHVAVPPTPSTAAGRLRVSPLARKTAAELHVDLTKVRGSGPDGAITNDDVVKAVARAAPPTEAAKIVQPVKPMVMTAERYAAMRKAIAAAMARSKREIPHYYLGTHIDMSRALAWLEAENLKRPVPERLLYAVLLLKAVALAIRQVPEMNGFWLEGAFVPSKAIHLGVAIALRQGGLIAPAIHEVDKKSVDELMHALRDLVKRARAGVLRSSEISDPTITVTSLGEQGVETVFGVIYPPQVAIVGFGKVTERPWAANGMIGVKPVIMTTLAADHRASDGHRGGLFLAAIDRLLQEPEKL